MCGCGDGQEGPISYTAPNSQPQPLSTKGNLGLKRIEPGTHNILIQLPSDQMKLHDHS